METTTVFKLVRRSLQKDARPPPLWATETNIRRNVSEPAKTQKNVSEPAKTQNDPSTPVASKNCLEDATDYQLTFECTRRKVAQILTPPAESTKTRKRPHQKEEELWATKLLLNDVSEWKQNTKKNWIHALQQIKGKHDSRFNHKNEISILCPPDVLDALKGTINSAVLTGLNILFETISRIDARRMSIAPPDLDTGVPPAHAIVPIGIFLPTSPLFLSQCEVPLFQVTTESHSILPNLMWRPSVVDGNLIPIDSNHTALIQEHTRLILSSEAIATGPLRPLVLFNVISCRIETHPPNIVELPYPPHGVEERLESAFTYYGEEVGVLEVVKRAWGLVEPPETISVSAFSIPIDLIATSMFPDDDDTLPSSHHQSSIGQSSSTSP